MTDLLQIVGAVSLFLLVWNLMQDFKNGGIRAALSRITNIITSLPGFNMLVSTYIKDEVVGLVNQLFKGDCMKRSVLVSIPQEG